MFWKLVIRKRDTKITKARFAEADSREDAAAEKRKTLPADWDIVSIEEISQADFVRWTRGD